MTDRNDEYILIDAGDINPYLIDTCPFDAVIHRNAVREINKEGLEVIIHTGNTRYQFDFSDLAGAEQWYQYFLDVVYPVSGEEAA